jgi:predicted ATP-grasp superfamily ATP-dependent carboligase
MSSAAGTAAMIKRIRKLAIVGASVRAAAFSAIRAGYEVVAADLFADADLQRACSATRVTGYPDSLADWLAETECDAWLYTGALENHPGLITRMSKLRPLLGNSGKELRAVRDPMSLQRVLSVAGLSFPETVDSPQGLPQDGSWLCKTYRGAGGSGVWLLDGRGALERAEREEAVFQRFIGGVSAAAVFVTSELGAELLGITRQLVGDARAGAKPWHYAGSIGPHAVSPEVESQLIMLGDVLSKRLQLRGLVGVDLVIANNRSWVLEINPRYSASAEIVERTTGRVAVREHVAACAGSNSPESRETNTPTTGQMRYQVNGIAHGKIILYAKRHVTITTAFFEWAVDQSSIDMEQCRLADIPSAGYEVSTGHPVLTLFAAASSKELDGSFAQRIADVESRLYSEQ